MREPVLTDPRHDLLLGRKYTRMAVVADAPYHMVVYAVNMADAERAFAELIRRERERRHAPRADSD